MNILTPLCIVKGVFNNGQSSQTVGSLDMGGASAQKVNSCHQKQEGHLFITSRMSSSFYFLFFCFWSKWPRTKKPAVLFFYFLYKKSIFYLKMTVDFFSFLSPLDQKMKNEIRNEPYNSLQSLGWKPFWSNNLFSRNKYVLLIHLNIMIRYVVQKEKRKILWKNNASGS